LRRLDLSGVNVRFVRWNERTEVRDISTFTVGLMPLPDDEWTRHKCGLKIIQYMALGVPAVASPVGANSEIIRHGKNGLLADSAENWLESLRRLLTDAESRAVFASAGRTSVEQTYSIQAQLPRWLEAVEAAIGRRQPLSPDHRIQ
jgi:glycosyltransferase involved in cell wall biosynthesis